MLHLAAGLSRNPINNNCEAACYVNQKLTTSADVSFVIRY